MPWPDPQNQLAFLNGAILLLGVLLYALLGGADFGGGIWDLLAGGPRAAEQRQVIAHAIGPIWEANHVWLIFVIVLVFTVFPPVFAALSIALYIPLSLALLGIVFRGAAFIFRTPARNVATGAGVWDRVFAVASTVTPVFFGMSAGAVASGQIQLVSGMPVSDPWRTWLAPFPLAIGLLALATCAYLAAVYLTLETTGELQEDFRRRALGAGAVFAVLAALALILARSGAPWIWHGLTSRAAVIAVPLGIGLALLSGWAVFARRYRLARVAAAAEVALLAGRVGAGAVPLSGRAGPDLRERRRLAGDDARGPRRLRHRRALPHPVALVPLHGSSKPTSPARSMSAMERRVLNQMPGHDPEHAAQPGVRQMDAGACLCAPDRPRSQANLPNLPNFPGMRNSGKFVDQQHVEARCRTRRPATPAPSEPRAGRTEGLRRLDVLVDPEEVVRVVLALDRRPAGRSARRRRRAPGPAPRRASIIMLT